MIQYIFAIVGAGNISKVHADVIQSLHNAKLAAVIDTDCVKAQSFAEMYGCAHYNSFDEMQRKHDVDVVSVCTPATTHADVAREIINAGKHIIFEKPIDTDTAKVRRLIAEAENKGVIISCIFQHRFDDAVIKAKKAIMEGRLGSIHFGACHTKWYRGDAYFNGRTKATDGGGALINQAIHYIDLLLYLVGDIVEVYGSCGVFSHKGIDIEDLGVAVVKFKNRGVGMIEGTTAAYPGLNSLLDIYGDKGSLRIVDDALVYYNVMDITKEEEETMISSTVEKTGASNPMDFPIESHRRQYIDVLNALENGTEPLVGGWEALKSVDVVSAIYTSSSTGLPVKI